MAQVTDDFILEVKGKGHSKVKQSMFLAMAPERTDIQRSNERHFVADSTGT